MESKFLRFLTLALIFVGNIAFAQTSQLAGVVYDESNEPIPGASVIVKGTTIGTATDFDGNFTIKVEENSTIEVSFIGYTTYSTKVGTQTNVSITLQPDAAALDEVVIVAYGTSKKSALTGSTTVVKADAIENLQVTNVTKSLQGIASGVQVSSSSGQPGEGGSIRIRGVGSISGSSEPLIVVDGMPFEGNMSSINPSDIESMTVLKDAASNALYGSRGANGVILITTKKGKAGETTVTLNARAGINRRAVPEYNIMNSASMYYQKAWETLYRQYLSLGKTDEEARALASAELVTENLKYNNYDVADDQVVGTDGKINDGNLLYSESWEDEAFSNGIRQEYDVSVSGGSESTKIMFSLGYLDDEGIITNSDFSRLSTRLNVNHKVKEWFDISLNSAYTSSESNSPDLSSSTSSANLFYITRTMAPIYPVYVKDGNGNTVYDDNGKMYDYGANRPHMAIANPLGNLKYNVYNTDRDLFSNKVNTQFRFLDHFTFSVNAGLDKEFRSYSNYLNGEYGQFVGTGGIGSFTRSTLTTFTSQQLLQWDRAFGDHNFDALAGHESYSRRYETANGGKENFFTPGNPDLDQAVKNPTAGSASFRYNLESYLSRVRYNYDEKYYLTASFRRDGSSKFSEENRWGNFWSVGGSWRMMKEGFMEDVNWLQELKLKSSYGTQGNDGLMYDGNMLYYPYLDMYNVVNLDGNPALDGYYKGNKDITWETNHNFNIGFDAYMFDRVSFSAEYFTRKSSDLLFYLPLAPTTGFSEMPVNDGEMINKGVEMDLNVAIFKGGDFNWDLSFNGTYYKNEILSLPAQYEENGIPIGSIRIREVGGSIYDFYLRKFAGVDNANGESLWFMDEVDADGNVTGQTTTNNWEEATQYNLGTSLADLFGGINTRLSYKGFDMSINMAYQIGGQVYDASYQNLMHSNSAGNNWHKDILNSWTPDNTDTNIPAVVNANRYNNSASDRWLIDASYFSLSNVTMGYSLPNTLVNKWNIQDVRFYVSGDNLWLASKREGLDPRQNFSGTANAVYSPISTISAGVNLKF
ncbi:MAG: TonB-dependent receptor [Flavobacteriales bacterium]|nr:TonB-dependent receptor [Flavobacteriales bacterium]